MKQSITVSAVIAALAVSGCAAATPGASRASGGAGAATTGPAGGTAAGQAVALAPVRVSMPASAAAPRHTATHTKAPAKPAASTTAPSQSSGGGSSSGSGSGGSSGGGTGGGTSSSCTHPSFSTSDPHGGETAGPYYMSNNEWNASNYSVSQTLSVCSAADWFVTANMNNNNGDGAVKTYPNAQQTWNNAPAISSLHSVSSSFAQSTTPGGIYEYAYDIWINGLATSGSTEVMIWTQNHGQTPSGSRMATVTISGHSFGIWKSGSYIAFVADQNFTSGTVDLLQFFDYIIGKGWIASSATLNQVDYGVELVSTGSAPETFAFTNFSVSAS